MCPRSRRYESEESKEVGWVLLGNVILLRWVITVLKSHISTGKVTKYLEKPRSQLPES